MQLIAALHTIFWYGKSWTNVCGHERDLVGLPLLRTRV